MSLVFPSLLEAYTGDVKPITPRVKLSTSVDLMLMRTTYTACVFTT